MKNKVYTRREFLKGSTSAAIASTLYFSSPDEVFAETEKKARVVLIRDKDVLDDLNKPKKKIIQQMLDEALTVLFEEKDAKNAWKQIVQPTDIVGVKSNEWRFLPTPKELESTIQDRVIAAGIPSKNISIDDRGVRNDPIFTKATALINVRPLRTHHWSGVGSLIKNYIMFAKKPKIYHPDSCANLASVWNLPSVKGKTRLNILVLFTPLFHGVGPHHFNPKYTWAYKGMIVGLDPVAVDATGIRILLAKRNEFFKEVSPLNPPPKHIFQADSKHKLGIADPKKIEVIKRGWKDGILI